MVPLILGLKLGGEIMDKDLIEASQEMLMRLQKAFEVMNWFAKGDHHYMEDVNGKKILRYGRTDHKSVLAEVYGILASGFGPFKEAVERR